MRNYSLLFLFLVLIVATFLRLYQLETVPPGLYPDEAMNGNNALEALRTGEFKVYYPENNGREGLFITIQAGFLTLIGQNEPWVLRLPNALFGILTVLGLYFLTKELFEKRIALLSSFLLATSVWHIIFSRIGFRAITAPFLLVWALYFLLLGFRKASSSEKNPLLSHFSFLISGAIFALGFYTYIAYRVMPLLVLFILWYYWRKSRNEGWQKQFLISTFSFLISAFIFALPIGLFYLQNPADFLGRTGQLSIFSSETPLWDLARNTVKTLGMFHVTGDWNWRHNVAGQPQLFWPVGILFIIGVFLGIQVFLSKNPNVKAQISNQAQSSNVKNSFSHLDFSAEGGSAPGGGFDLKFGFWILFLWFLLAMLPVVISNEGIPHALRAILMAPPVFIFAAVGGMWLYEKISAKYESATKIRRILLSSIFYFLFSLLILEAYQTYFIQWAQNPNTAGAFAANYVTLGRTLNEMPREVPKYVVVPLGGVLVRGIPMPAQAVMFITDTYLPENQQAKNIHYLLPGQEKNLLAGSLIFHL